MWEVVIDVSEKKLRKLPKWILRKLDDWIYEVETIGLYKTREGPGWHDEPLQGKRFGQRSIRLNRAYRAIYKLDGKTIIVVLEVNKHDY